MEIEWLILADSAQIVGNKLYLLGGGWDVAHGIAQQQLGLVLCLLVRVVEAAIVQEVVTMHDGIVEAQSKGVGRGATFIVKLPFQSIALMAGRR